MRVAFSLFITAILFPVVVNAGVVINEIAWMGTVPREGESAQAAANNEWIELYNSFSDAVSLDGWTLSSADLRPNITLSGNIPAGGFYLMERTSDDVVPGVAADLIYPYKDNALSNTGEHLFLKDSSGNSIDEVNASSGWPAGDNTTKETMQGSGLNWITAAATPKAVNSGSTPPPPPVSDPEPPPPPPAPAPEPKPEPESVSPPPAEPVSTPYLTPEPASIFVSPPPVSEPAPVRLLSSTPTSSTTTPAPTPTLTPFIQPEAASNPPAAIQATLIETPKSPLESLSQPTVNSIKSENNQEPESQTALISESLPEEIQSSIFSSGWFWFGAAIVLGILSAGGVFAARKFL